MTRVTHKTCIIHLSGWIRVFSSFLIKHNLIKENNKTIEKRKNSKKTTSHPYRIGAEVKKKKNHPKNKELSQKQTLLAKEVV